MLVLNEGHFVNQSKAVWSRRKSGGASKVLYEDSLEPMVVCLSVLARVDTIHIFDHSMKHSVNEPRSLYPSLSDIKGILSIHNVTTPTNQSGLDPPITYHL